MKNIVLNRYYRKLRNTSFKDLEIAKFMDVYINFKRLKLQYRFLQIANFLEKVYIPVIEIPFLRFFSKLLDFIKWKLHDLFIRLINGRTFNLFGVTIFCGRQGSRKDNRHYKRVGRDKT